MTESQTPQDPLLTKRSLTSDPQSWRDSYLISVTQITPRGLELLYSTTIRMRLLVKSFGGDSRLANKILSCVFYEASTRTACSFQAAMLRLGGKVMMIDAGTSGNTSASKKGESLSDTIKCLESYSDVTVLRHPVKGSVEDVVRQGTRKPLLNAGDGIGEHPTQALLDLFTILDELGIINQYGVKDENSCDGADPLIVVMLGDLKHGRTVHSLAKLLAQACSGGFLNKRLILRYCSPPTLAMPQDVKDYVNQVDGTILQEEIIGDDDAVTHAIKNAHVLYVTRVQKERFNNVNDYEAVKGAYVVNVELMSKAPPKMIVMHPLPRVDEIATEVDNDPRAAYFRQMENGMYVRMAILALIFGCP